MEGWAPGLDREHDLLHYDGRAFRLAAANIASAIGTPPSGSALVVCSPVKKDLAEQVCRELLTRNAEAAGQIPTAAVPGILLPHIESWRSQAMY